MAFSLGGLTAYTEQNKLSLIRKSLFGSKTISMINKQPGIKSSATVNIITTDAIFQNGASCSPSASGTTSLTQRTLTVGNIVVYEKLCPKDLEAYYLQTQMQAGDPDSIPFEQMYTDYKSAIIAKQLETAVWQGDTGSGDANLARFDGLLKIIAAASPVTATASTINTTNIRTIMQNIYSLIPAQVLGSDDLAVFVGDDTFRTYQIKLAIDNLYHKSGEANAMEITLENSSIPVIAVPGLNGTNKIVAARKSNLYFGTDLMNEEEQFLMKYEDTTELIHYKTRFKAGTQIAFGDEIVYYANA